MITSLLDRIGITCPILQAPMIGPKTALAAAVSAAGGLGSVACAIYTPEQLAGQVDIIRAVTTNPFNLNFFCHTAPVADVAREGGWRRMLRSYYLEFGLDPDAEITGISRAAFDAAMCDAVLAVAPRVVSFHFGLPVPPLVDRLRAAGILILSSATTVPEARWLADHGADAIIAQGIEAGGHRGMFLTDDLSTQAGLMALLPQIVDAVSLPVIAAGGIADGRGVAAALALGASAVQVGTAYLRCPEAGISDLHREALEHGSSDATALTNLMTGRPARGIVNRLMRERGPINARAPAFPGAALALQPLRQAAETQGSGDFSPLWSGQSAALARTLPAAELTRILALDARSVIDNLHRREAARS